MRNIFRATFAFTISLLILCVGTASAELVVDQNYQLVSSIRVGRTAYDYTYQVNITNNGSDVQNVTAAVSSGSLNTTIIDGSVNFGDVASGITVAGTDTFTIRQNRSYAFDPNSLTWNIQFELAAQIIPPEGGEIQGEGGIVLIVPAGATSDPIPVTITLLQANDLGATPPPNTTFLGGAAIDMGQNELMDNADISMPAPDGVPDGAEVYLAKLVEYAGQTMFQLVDTAIVQNGIIVSQDPAFPGVTASGNFCFLWAQNVGWVEGQATNINSGVEVPEAVVTLSGGYWLDIADAGGYYSLPAWAGNFVVNAFDDQTGDFGEKQGFMPNDGATVLINVEIGESSGPTQSTLINGNFEDGLTGWVLSGAGDVVDSFGTILPHGGNYMAMISSGNGAVGDASSALEQTFTVPEGANKLTIYYNFISEEYPEFVGSVFNDVMRATLHTPDGSREIAFEEVNSANFEPVSGIPCGSGDCTWGQTGWIEASIDVSQWAGTDDTLTLTVHDVGDTIYDTVVLLDDIEFEEESDIAESLDSGQTVSDSVSANEWMYYKISTQASDAKVNFDLTHLSDDINMYVRKGSIPTIDENGWDCRPFKTNDGNYIESETCVMDNSGENVWYVGVHGNENGGNYRLTAIIGGIKGWSTDTKFKKADTDIRESIVALANNAIGVPSGQSVVCTGDNCWLTDIACYTNSQNNWVCDGAFMRDAISIYHDWREANPEKVSGDIDETTYDAMIDEFDGSAYPDAQQEDLVDQIINVYDDNGRTVPTTDDETLVYMNIQKQCLEWAMFIADQAGGSRVNYGGSGAYTANSNEIRPGMGFYNLNTHAMLIIDVEYDENGEPTRVKVAESNFPQSGEQGWQNPPGQVPWERTIRGDRVLAATDHIVINYDK